MTFLRRLFHRHRAEYGYDVLPICNAAPMRGLECRCGAVRFSHAPIRRLRRWSRRNR